MRNKQMRVILTKEEVENIVLSHVNQRVILAQGFDKAEITSGYYHTEFCVVTSRDPEARVATLTTGGDHATE
jgi:hypothetical protein